MLRHLLRLLPLCLLVTALGFVSQNVTAQINLNFGTNFTRKIGTGDIAANDKFLYTAVSPGIDCIVTLVSFTGNATIPTEAEFDDNTNNNGGAISRFQPRIYAPDLSNNTSYARFSFQLITAGSYNSGSNTGTNVVPAEPIFIRVYDVDGGGGGGDANLREFVELSSSFTGT